MLKLFVDCDAFIAGKPAPTVIDAVHKICIRQEPCGSGLARDDFPHLKNSSPGMQKAPSQGQGFSIKAQA
jgi:hypothetical protein